MYNIAIFSYNYDKYSETFIHNLVKYLPFNSHYLYGSELPEYYGNHQKFLSEGGFTGVLVALREWMGVSRYEQHQKRVEEYMVSNKIDVVLANYSLTAFPVMEICRRKRIPLIVHFHGWTAYRSTILEQHRSDYKRLFELSKAIVAVSNDMKKQLINLGAQEDRIEVFACGYEEQIFQYSDHSQNPNDFVAVGRFCDTKNPHLTILAFSKVLKEIPDARLIMIGGDETLLNVSLNMAKALNIYDRVEFCGVLKHEEVALKMRSALAFVQHSAVTILNEKEGTPVAILEACASGLPVIATRHGGISDVIIEEETGLLCDDFDIDTMAANMIRISHDRVLAKKLGEQAAKRVAEHFTMEQYIDKLSHVIRSAAA